MHFPCSAALLNSTFVLYTETHLPHEFNISRSVKRFQVLSIDGGLVLISCELRDTGALNFHRERLPVCLPRFIILAYIIVHMAKSELCLCELDCRCCPRRELDCEAPCLWTAVENPVSSLGTESLDLHEVRRHIYMANFSFRELVPGLGLVRWPQRQAKLSILLNGMGIFLPLCRANVLMTLILLCAITQPMFGSKHAMSWRKQQSNSARVRAIRV